MSLEIQVNERFRCHARIGLLRNCIGKERLKERINAGEELGEVHTHVHPRRVIKVGQHLTHFVAPIG